MLSGRDIKWYIGQGLLVISPVIDIQFQQNGIDLVLGGVRQLPRSFMPCRFYLGTTAETILMPNDLMAFVELRSTWARRGLIIPPTIVDAGFQGTLTLEIFSAVRVDVPYGERFAHLVFDKLTSPSLPYNGKYQGQHGVTESTPDAK